MGDASTKPCLKCGNVGGYGGCGYYTSTRHADGLNQYCIHCCKVNRALESVRKRDKSSKVSFRQEYRAKTMGIHYEEGITLAFIFNRDLGICGVCKEWVAPRYASLDHTHPLSKGGHHTKANLQLTHIRCNLVKGHRIGH